MSQNQIVKPTLPQPLLSLNLRNVNSIFPGFAEGDFAVIKGSNASVTLSSLLCVRAQLANQLGGLGSNVMFIDGGNTFDLYQIARLAQIHHLNPKQALDNIYISRAFTAYQVTALVLQKLKVAIKKYNAKLVIVSDISGFFLDKELPEHEAQRLFSKITSFLSVFAKENHVIVLATYLPHRELQRNQKLQYLAQERANVVLSLKQTKQSKEVALEKHPYLSFGSVELPPAHATLTDFMECAA